MLILKSYITRLSASLFLAVLTIYLSFADNNKVDISLFGYKVQPPINNLSELGIGTAQTSASVSSMGASICDILIDAPKGPAGVKPQIGLSYNSLRGVGLAGYGFDISGISVITRGMRDIYHDEKNNGISFTDDDAFFLDGKRLIKSNDVNDKVTFNPEGDMDITVYMGHDEKSHGIPVFIVQDSEGNTITYGSSVSTRNDYTSSSGKYCNTAWYVDKCVDRCGNITQYHYIKDNMHVYPLRIEYGSNVGCSVSSKNVIEFSYDSLPASERIPYRCGGNQAFVGLILKKITTKSGNDIFRQYTCEYGDGAPAKRLLKVTVANDKGETLPPTTLAWHPMTSNYSASDIDIQLLEENRDLKIKDRQYLSLDINSDGYDDIVELSNVEEKGHSEGGIHYYTYLNYYKNTAKYDSKNPQFVYCKTLKLSPNISGKLSTAWEMPACIDFDGDGLNDIVICDKREIYGDNDVIWTIVPGKSIADYSWDYNMLSIHTKCKGTRNVYTYGDFNNNGRTDIFQMEQTPVAGLYPCHFISCTDSIVANKRMVADFSLPLSSEPCRLFASDFDGDGTEDLMVVCKTEYSIFWNNRDSIPFSSGNMVSRNNVKEVTNIQLGDFNGDGMADIVMNQEGESVYRIAFANGDGTFSEGEAFMPNLPAENQDKDNVKYTMVVTDLDRDGRSDVVIAKAAKSKVKSNDIVWLYSNGNTLVQKRHVSMSGEDESKWFNTMLGHFTGNGSLGLIHFGGNILNGDDTCGKRLYSDSSWNCENGLLASVTDGMGKKTTFSYTMLFDTGVYTCSKKSAWPVLNVNFPLTIVKSMSKTNGTYDDTEFTYKYSNLQIEKTGRGLLPFETMEIYDDCNEITTTTTIKKWDKELWLPLSTISTKKGKDWTSITETDNVIIKKPNKNYILLPSKINETDPEGLITSIENFYDQDYGYITSSSKYLDNGRMYDLTCFDEYKKYKGTWLPTTIYTTTKHSDDKNKCVATTKVEYYDNGLAKNTTTLFGTDMATTKSMSYDSWGNMVSVSVSAPKTKSATTYLDYDSTGCFLIGKRTMPTTTSLAYTYDKFGNIKSMTDNTNQSRPLITTYTYDSWGRLLQTISPRGGVSATKIYAMPNNGYAVASMGNGSPWRMVWYDQVGRKTKEQTIGIGDVVETKSYVYDKVGNMTSAKMEKGALNFSQTMEYDSRNRVVKMSDSRGNELLMSYGPKKTTTIRNGKKYTTSYDSWGNVKGVRDPLCAVSNYYCSNGKPSKSGIYPLYTTMEYDIAGNRTKMDDPDSGVTTYEYNGLGQLLTQTDARGVTTENIYDDLNRLVKTDIDGISTTYEYGKSGNSFGLPMKEQVNDMKEEREYNEYGDVIKETRNIKGRNMSFKYSYDSLGRVREQTFPNGLKLKFVYDSYGNHVQTLKGTSNVWKFLSFDGKTQKEQIGKDFVRTTVLDSCGYPLSISLMKGTKMLHEMNFHYDPQTGNLMSRRGMEPEGSPEKFTYDDLDRLTSYTELDHYVHNMEYDKYGRIKYKYGVGNYEVGHGHNVMQVSNELDSITGYPQAVLYNGYGKVVRITGINGTLNIEYGPDMERWYEKDDRANRTIYFFGDYECQEKSDDYLDICYLDGGVLYMSSRHFADVYCAFTDNLGSYVKIYSSSGEEVFHSSYDAWGKPKCLKNDIGFHRGYCGHEMIDGGWLINMNGRIYDPWIAMFLSPDNYIQDPLNSQNFNRYSYCINNPLKYTDPTGNMFEVFIAFSLFNIASNMMIASMNGQNMWKAAARSALVSFATYGIGQAFGNMGSIAHEALRAGAHGVVGGIANVLGGGSFGSGFLSSLLSSGLGSYISSLDMSIVGKYASSAIVGGVSAWASSGDILSGALQGLTIGFLNHGVHENNIDKEINLSEVEVIGNAQLYKYTRAIGIYATSENALTILKGFNDYMRKVRIGTNGKMYLPKKKGQFRGNQYVKTKPLKGIPYLGKINKVYQAAEDIGEINIALIEDGGQWGENCERCVVKLTGKHIGTIAGSYAGKLSGQYFGQGVFSVPLGIGMGIAGGYVGGALGENISLWIYDYWY